MKKILLILSLCVIFLCGCQSETKAAPADTDAVSSKYAEEFSQIDEVLFFSQSAPEPIETVQGEENAAQFFDALDSSGWTEADLPSDANPLGIIYCLQSSAAEFGGTDPDAVVKPTCTIVVYEDSPYISLNTENVQQTLKVSTDAYTYLCEKLTKQND